MVDHFLVFRSDVLGDECRPRDGKANSEGYGQNRDRETHRYGGNGVPTEPSYPKGVYKLIGALE